MSTRGAVKKGQAGVEQKWQTGRSWIQLQNMTNLVTNLSDEQQQTVKDIGFDKLLMLKPYSNNKLPMFVTWWLVSRVDTDEGVLMLGRESINIEASVSRILGLPEGPHGIEPRRILDTEEDKELLELKLRFTESGQGKGLLASAVMDDMKKKDGNLFYQYFVVLALSFYLAPANNPRINRDYLSTIRYMYAIKNFNWSKFVAQYLISGIITFRNKSGSNMKGCVHILHLLYFDYYNRKYCPSWNVNLDTLIENMGQSDLDGLEVPEEIILENPVEDTRDENPIEMPAADRKDDAVRMILQKYIEEPRCTNVKLYKQKLLDGLPHLSSEIRGIFDGANSLDEEEDGPEVEDTATVMVFNDEDGPEVEETAAVMVFNDGTPPSPRASVDTANVSNDLLHPPSTCAAPESSHGTPPSPRASVDTPDVSNDLLHPPKTTQEDASLHPTQQTQEEDMVTPVARFKCVGVFRPIVRLTYSRRHIRRKK